MILNEFRLVDFSSYTVVCRQSSSLGLCILYEYINYILAFRDLRVGAGSTTRCSYL